MTVVLDNRMQSAVRHLLMAEPEPGSMLPDSAVDSLLRLIACDGFGVIEADRTGYRLRITTVPYQVPRDPQLCDGPLPTGLWHDAEAPDDERAAAGAGLRDLIRLSFTIRSGNVVQLWFSRRRCDFSDLELGLLSMVEPALGRLTRAGAGEAPAHPLSPSERRVLAVVASGASNREAAEELYVTEHTVRKHLENAYRKLGVSNRTAAVLKLQAEA